MKARTIVTANVDLLFRMKSPDQVITLVKNHLQTNPLYDMDGDGSLRFVTTYNALVNELKTNNPMQVGLSTYPRKFGSGQIPAKGMVILVCLIEVPVDALITQDKMGVYRLKQDTTDSVIVNRITVNNKLAYHSDEEIKRYMLG